MTFWQALKATYGGSLTVLVAFPLLALVPVIFELVQHVVEVRSGIYDSAAAFGAAGNDSLLLSFGLLKVASLYVPLYWINRFLAFRDASFAKAIIGSACLRFAPFVVVQLIITALVLFVLPQTGVLGVASFFASLIVGFLLMPWGVAAPLDNGQVSPAGSAAIMWRQIPWTIVFYLVAALPLLIPHYIFGFQAIGAKGLLWPLLILDSLLVGCLTAVLAAVGFYAAMRAAAKTSVSLMPPQLPLHCDPARASRLGSL